LEIECRIKRIDKEYRTGFTKFRTSSGKDFLKYVTKKYFGYNIMKIDN
jgi:hypothetical protein